MCDERNILRVIRILRKELGNSFTSGTVRKEAGVAHVKKRTVRHYLNKNGYYFRHSRKKGLVTQKDRLNHVKFARKVLTRLTSEFWKEGVSFYLDGVGFVHKTNPSEQARYNGNMAYRLKSEGLALSSKGKKEGVNGKVANFFVAISYKKGVVLCEQYLEQLNGENFSKFVRQHFPAAFKKSSNPKGMLFLQDGDPTQNSRKAKKAFDDVGCRMFSIPARSPDINPIENMFNNVRKRLGQDTIDKRIEYETYEEFSKRVRRTLLNFPTDIIDNTIESLPKRMKLILKGKGYRTKY